MERHFYRKNGTCHYLSEEDKPDKVSHVSSSFVAIGTDMFNFNLTGTITGTLRGQRVDVISIPHILLIYEETTNHD